jgi:AcrR family transcriptional regulator
VRRRGAALEATILEAAWQELAAVGYSRLTMEGVAARARTGKQVLYRRWRNRAELVIAAMHHTIGSITDRLPDSGGLRGDVLDILGQMAQRQRAIGPDVLRGLMAEVPDLDPQVFAPRTEVMTAVLRRAAERGEINGDDLHSRVVTLPIDLLRHHMLLSREPVEDNVVREIVDEVFLPLVQPAAGGHD